MVMVLLGCFVLVAVPKYYDLSGQAKEASEQGVVGGVRSGILGYFVGRVVNTAPSAGLANKYPLRLDNVPAGETCSVEAPCFIEVLAQGGITADWKKGGSVLEYIGPTGNLYVYEPATGTFDQQSTEQHGHHGNHSHHGNHGNGNNGNHGNGNNGNHGDK